MGGGNSQKSKMALERNLEKNKAAKGASLFLFTLNIIPLSLPVLPVMCFLRAIALMDLRVFSVQGASLRPTRRP
jgi:hypothetical protein